MFRSPAGRSFAFTLPAILILVLVSALHAERLPIKTYTVADGLVRDYVYKIKRDSRGFLWFCTPGGISRFDGYAFTNFTTNDGLPDRRVNDFLETRNGEIWIATGNGLAKLNPKGIRAPFQESIQNTKSKSHSSNNSLFTVYTPENPKARNVYVLFEGEAGRIFAGTSDGLYQLNEQSELAAVNLGEPLANALEITSIIKDRRGLMWIGTDNGLYCLFSNGEIKRFAKENGLPDTNISVVYEDRNGRIWVGLRPRFSSGLILLTAEPEKNQFIVERHYRMTEGLPAHWITNLFETGDGKFWVGTIRGLCLWQGGENSVCKTYTSANNLCDSEIWALNDDQDGNLWAGTRCGAKKLARYGFTTYDKADGVETPFLNSIFENAAGELFVSSDTGEARNISRFNGEKFDFVRPNFSAPGEYFGSGERQTVWQDRTAGDWWFPSGNGLYRFSHPAKFEDLAKIKPQRISPVAERREIFRLFEDSRGDFWIATGFPENGLWHWERKSNVWRDYSKELGFSKNRIGTTFVEDRSGNLWIGTGEDDAALIRYRDRRFTVFTKADNLPAGSIANLFIDSIGRLWLANTSAGLLRIDDVNAEHINFVRYSIAEGLSAEGAMCVTEDEFGRIYACTGRGLDRLNPATNQIENFTTADGLPNSYPQISYRDSQNNLWFTTTDGLAKFTPEPQRERKPPSILITGLHVNGIAQPISVLGETTIPNLELDPRQRQVSIDFVGLGANLGERLKYEYRLGAADWTETTQRTVNFANLAAGDYQFEIRAVTADRIYSVAPANLTFRIAAPIWQRWWFVTLILSMTALLIYLFYKNRLTRLLMMERMRTRIATDLHDDIGANLTRISLLSEVAKQQSENGNGKLLTSIADIARESVASMNDIVWAISPDHDSLLDLTRRMRQHAEEVFALRDVQLNFKAPATDLKLSVGARRDVLLIFKEAVNNAARHSGCTKVEIDLLTNNATLFLRIKDDGKGFETDSDDQGQGLPSMKRRARALGGIFKLDSSPKNGTIIEFEMPLPNVNRV